MISLAHLKFRKARGNQKHVFPSLWYPFSNWLCLAFMLMILGIMLFTPGAEISVYILPAWLVLLWACFRLKTRSEGRASLAKQAG